MNQNTMLGASTNRHVIAFAEANTSAGTYGAYDVRTKKVSFEATGNRAFVQGRLRMSEDGSWLFCTVKGGVCHLHPRLKESTGTLSADRR